MNDNVSSVSSSTHNTISHLVEVNLQNNLLWKWQDVSLLGAELPNLSVLLLHGNKFQSLNAETVTSFDRCAVKFLSLVCFNG